MSASGFACASNERNICCQCRRHPANMPSQSATGVTLGAASHRTQRKHPSHVRLALALRSAEHAQRPGPRKPRSHDRESVPIPGKRNYPTVKPLALTGEHRRARDPDTHRESESGTESELSSMHPTRKAVRQERFLRARKPFAQQSR